MLCPNKFGSFVPEAVMAPNAPSLLSSDPVSSSLGRAGPGVRKPQIARDGNERAE
jgi:hypothetical protein